MSWIGVAWPMMGALGLALALVHALIWFKQRNRADHLMFAMICAAVAVVAILELMMMRAPTPERYAFLLRWAHVPVVAIAVGIVGFVRLHFRAGNIWLGATAVVSRCATLLPDFLSGVNLNFREINALQRLPIWGSERAVAVPIGVPNHWMALGTISIVVLIVFLADAILAVWRRNDASERRRVTIVCGSMILFATLAGGWTLAVVSGVIHAPLVVIPAFLGVVLVMSYELGGDILRAAQLAESLHASDSKLRVSEERMTLAVQAAGISLWTWDIARDKEWYSEAGLRMLGIPSDGEATESSFLDRVNASDRDKIREALAQAAERNGEFKSDFRISSPSGRTSWIAARGRVEFDANRAPLRLNGILLDVTERKQAEERFRLVVEGSPTAMLMIDSDGRIALANHQAEAVFGYPRADLIGMSVDALLPLQHRARHAAHRSNYFSGATMRAMGAGRELFGRRKDESAVAVEISLNPIEIDTRRFVLASITDIGERKRMERESVMQRDELAYLSRITLMSELSGSLAHELNQPLTAILSNAQAAVRFLGREPPDLKEVQESLSNIVESDKRAGEIIRRLRAMMRKDPVDHVSLDINELVEEVLRIVRNDLLSRRIEIELDLGKDLPAVSGDRVQLQQVLMNLIRNGSDAMAGGPADARLTLRTRPAGDGDVEVSVGDIGCGIPAANLERIFSPFFTSKSDGMGLGLAVCTTIINAHRGKLWATNNTSRGATVHFSVPALSRT